MSDFEPEHDRLPDVYLGLEPRYRAAAEEILLLAEGHVWDAYGAICAHVGKLVGASVNAVVTYDDMPPHVQQQLQIEGRCDSIL